MSSESNIKNYRPWWHRSNRLPRNPFDPLQVIQHLEWCKVCQMDVDVQIEAGNADGVDVYRKCCKRCGNVMQYGMARRRLLSPEPLPAKAIQFIQETGKDRR